MTTYFACYLILFKFHCTFSHSRLEHVFLHSIFSSHPYLVCFRLHKATYKSEHCHRNNNNTNIIIAYVVLSCHFMIKSSSTIVLRCQLQCCIVWPSYINCNKPSFVAVIIRTCSANSCRAIQLLLPPSVSYTYDCGWRLSKLSPPATLTRPTIGLTIEVGFSSISILNKFTIWIS